MSWTQFLLGGKPKTHIKDVSGFLPQLLSDREAYHIVNEPPFEVEDLFINGRSRSNMYQRYIFLQEEGGPSAWISTHMVHRWMEMRIDQVNISI